MKILNPSLVLLVLFSSSKGFAEETRGVPGPESPPRPALAAPSTTSLAAGPVLPVRPLLREFAHQEALHRYGEGAVGLAGSGLLIGAGFAADPHDRTWSSVLWVTGGVVALGSIGSLLVPSELETLEQGAGELSEEELRARWRELAQARRFERRAGAVVGALFGATSIVLGGLVLDGELGKFDDDPRRLVGLGLITSGGLGIVESGVKWFVPSAIEVGSTLASTPPALGLAVAPTTTGFALAVTGEF